MMHSKGIINNEYDKLEKSALFDSICIRAVSDPSFVVYALLN